MALLGVLGSLALVPPSALAAAPPALLGAISNNTNLSGVTSLAVSGQVAYTTAYWPGQLTAVDISNPSSPTVLGSTAATLGLQNATDVTIAGNYAYVTSKNRNASAASNDDGSGNSLTIVDISNPSSPSVVGAATNAANPNKLFGAYSVAVAGNYAFVAYQGRLAGQPSTPGTTTGGFTVLDVSNTSAPTVVANIDNGSLTGSQANDLYHATSVAISGHYVYVTAFYGARLTVIDIANPAAPKIVTALGDATRLKYPNNVTIVGHYAYVADQNSATGVQFSIVDITTPSAPVVVGSLTNVLLDNAYTLRVRGNFAYLVAKNTSVMAVIDISNPANPQVAGYVQDAGHLFSVIGIEVDSTGAYAITASPRLSSESSSIYPPFPTNTGTVSVIQLDPAPISVTIAPSSEPPNPTSTTSADFKFSIADQIATVACKLDNASFAPCTSGADAQYSGLANGVHSFTVQATDAAGRTASASYTWTVGTQSGTPPHNTAPPTISGAAVQHRQLTGGLGSWTGNPTPSLSEKWLRCNSSGSACHAIASATAASYTLTSADVGSRIRLLVRATNPSGSAEAQSAATAVVKANAAATLTGVARRHAKLDLTGVRVVSALNEIDIALPHGLRYVTRAKRLTASVRVTDELGKRVAFTVVVRHGVLSLTLERAVQTAHVMIGPGAIRVSSQLAASVRRKLTHRLTVTVVLGLAGGPHFQTAVRVRVS